MSLASLAGARIPHAPPPHLCSEGPVWQAATIDNSLRWGAGLAKIARGKWISTATGIGAGTAIPTAISVDNGENWTPGGTIPNPTGQNPFFLKFGNGRLLCYMSGGSAGISDDGGATWSRNAALGFVATGLEFAQGLFVWCSSASSLVARSADGITGLVTNATPVAFAAIKWVPAKSWWIGIEQNGVSTYTSPDLTTWTQRGDLPVSEGFGLSGYKIAVNGLTVVMSLASGVLYAIRSADGGETWAATSNLVTTSVTQVRYGNGIFLIWSNLGGDVQKSLDDGNTWSASDPMTTGVSEQWYVEWDGLNTWVALGATGSTGDANLGIC